MEYSSWGWSFSSSVSACHTLQTISLLSQVPASHPFLEDFAFHASLCTFSFPLLGTTLSSSFIAVVSSLPPLGLFLVMHSSGETSDISCLLIPPPVSFLIWYFHEVCCLRLSGGELMITHYIFLNVSLWFRTIKLFFVSLCSLMFLLAVDTIFPFYYFCIQQLHFGFDSGMLLHWPVQ